MTNSTDTTAMQIATNLRNLESEVQSSREALAGDPASLGAAQARLARAEGEHRFWITAQQALDDGETGTEAMEAALDEAVGYIEDAIADGTWSGVDRPHFDGALSFMQRATADVEEAS